MRRSFAFLLLCVLAHFTSAQTPTRDEQSILDLSRKKFDWIVGKQYDSLARVLDDRMLFVHSNGWTQNKKELIGDIQSGKLNYQKITIKESSARMYPSTAIVLGLGTFEGINDGKPFTLDLRYTEVYAKIGNQWKLASRHASRMP